MLAEGYIYPREERGARDLARKRLQLVRYRTAQILSIESILMRQTGARMKSEAVKGLTAEQVDVFAFAPDVALAVEANRAVSQALGQQIEALERQLKERVSLRAEYHLLKTVPGIGQTLATTIMLETGSMARFAQVGNFSSYCRCVDSLRESNGKKKGEGNTKNGNKFLAWAFVEAANFALRCCPQAKASTIARRASRMVSWQSRLWRTSWRGRATTCCGTRSPSMCTCVSDNGLAKGGEPGKRTGVKLLE